VLRLAILVAFPHAKRMIQPTLTQTFRKNRFLW
jgi:hypothetical protein